MKDYQKLALRTCSPGFYSENVDGDDMKDLVSAFVDAGNVLDQFKKALFYDKKLISAVEIPFPELTRQQVDLLHSGIGQVTEAIEYLDAVWQHIEGDELDRVNLIEEHGDGEWYHAIGREALGVTQEEVQEINIKKLRHRFPERFTTEHAENRDLDGERQILESK